MGSWNFWSISRQSFPLVFAFVFTLVYIIMATLFPLSLMHMPSIFFLPVMSSIILLPFMMIGNGNPAVLFSGAIIIALLSGAIQYGYWKWLSAYRKWQYVLLVVVTCVQTGLLLGLSFILAYSLDLL